MTEVSDRLNIIDTEDNDIIMENNLLRKLHHEEEYYIKDLAKAWNMKEPAMWCKIKRYGIEIKLQPTRYFASVYDKIDANEFDKLYYVDDLSGDKIAKIFSIDIKTMYKWMQLKGRPTKGYIMTNYPTIGEKQCSICKQFLPLENFSNFKNGYDGYFYRCKECDGKISKEYKTTHEDEIKVKRTKRYYSEEGNIKIKYRGYKERNKEKFNLDIQISIDEVKEIITKPCVYCGEMDIPVNGLDRVDNTKGYEKDNVVSCCRCCNTMKMNLTVDEFREHIEKIYKKFIIGKNDRAK